ncbi:NTP transferase domain-containing protein [Helicobacter cynogastricus]|uniref:NTP transferase domain-containing protein n=1 Tax=Helicobacter cynogastricus TaxID=329937 RepID=UPI001F205430|nr:NTP transferase domain-containing protein [Helicobacter cynogastricus]
MLSSDTLLNIPCVILTGGRSARMRVGVEQRDKALLEFGNYPTLLAYQHAKMSALFERVYISAKRPYPLHARYILDTKPLFSPLLGIVSALKTLQESVFIIPIDMPLVRAQTILKLCECAFSAGVVYAKSERFYLLGCFQMSMLESLERALRSNGSIAQILQEGLGIELEPSAEFSNCNTYAEYQEALRSWHG